MRFLYLALHYPRQEHTQNLLTAMGDLGAAMRGAPGLIEATAWLEKDGQRIVATSIWESEETFNRAISVIQGAVKDVPFADWEQRPRELFQLNELPKSQ
jgi:quinol monooxygenase YgiN